MKNIFFSKTELPLLNQKIESNGFNVKINSYLEMRSKALASPEKLTVPDDSSTKIFKWTSIRNVMVKISGN